MAKLQNDSYFLKLVEAGYFSISSDGIITNTKTKYIIGSNQKGIGYIGVRHSDTFGVMHNIQAHRLVWLALHGPITDESLVVNHIDLNKRNNHPNNLELVTASRNMLHAYQFIEAPKGENRLNASFSDDEVREYRQQYKHGGVSINEVAKTHAISYSTARLMLKGLTYTHI